MFSGKFRRKPHFLQGQQNWSYGRSSRPISKATILWNRRRLQGKPQYPLLFSIDGQSVLWEMPGVRADTPMYDSRGRKVPEGGKGMKYSIEKKLVLAPGPHRVTIALPGEEYEKEIDIALAAGSRNVLEFKPVYAPGGIGHYRSFLHGVKNMEAFLNGREILKGEMYPARW